MSRESTLLADPFTALRRRIDRLFEDYPSPFESPWFRQAPTFPALNVWEDEENLYVEAEIPGVTTTDIDVSATGKELTIKGRREPLAGENLTYHRLERGTGDFTRVVALPVEVEADRVQARLRDGVLTLTLPKSETARRKKITVTTG